MRTTSVRFGVFGVLSMSALLAACGGVEGQEDVVDEGPSDNPFLAIENEDEKADTAYINPAGKEVEVTLEADVAVTDSYSVRRAPAELGQFALTYLRKHSEFYLESLAENAGSGERVEWKVGTTWKKASQVTSTPASQLTHFRINGVNAVLLNSTATGLKVGKVFKATVPKNPFSMMAAVGDSCGEVGGHIGLSDDVYWYLWEPEKSGCRAVKQEMTITVSKLLAKGHTVYPEYDKLTADKKITAVILFGQIDDGAITDNETGVRGFNRVAQLLLAGKYKEVKGLSGQVGRRFSKLFGTVTMEIDLYSPREFAGLGDYAHLSNLQKAISEHEIVAYDGHSMLGGSDFWSRPTYPQTYQIFLYGGCLGYEYYVKPIVDGKGGTWANLDLLSSVVEVSANAELFAVPVLAKITYALTHGNRVSWQQLLTTVRNSVGDSTFGASGIRDNVYCPPGVTCGT